MILFSLVALEKFAQTSENKLTINDHLTALPVHPLVTLEQLEHEEDEYVKMQIAFSARWCLDNLCKHPCILYAGIWLYAGTKEQLIRKSLHAHYYKVTLGPA